MHQISRPAILVVDDHDHGYNPSQILCRIASSKPKHNMVTTLNLYHKLTTNKNPSTSYVTQVTYIRAHISTALET